MKYVNNLGDVKLNAKLEIEDVGEFGDEQSVPSIEEDPLKEEKQESTTDDKHETTFYMNSLKVHLETTFSAGSLSTTTTSTSTRSMRWVNVQVQFPGSTERNLTQETRLWTTPPPRLLWEIAW